MRILSIDWDYFFPNSANYDWGANEERGIYYEMIWQTRCGNQNLVTGADMLSEYKPTIQKDFWKIVRGKPRKMIIADSHFALWGLLGWNADVTNIDAHHDCGYSVKWNGRVDCGSWGIGGLETGRIEMLHLYYPEWRRNQKEGHSPKLVEIHYGMPDPAKYDKIFVCRSSCWTPPWYDLAFQEFVKSSGFQYEIIDEMGWKLRKPESIEQAEELAAEFRKILMKVA